MNRATASTWLITVPWASHKVHVIRFFNLSKLSCFKWMLQYNYSNHSGWNKQKCIRFVDIYVIISLPPPRFTNKLSLFCAGENWLLKWKPFCMPRDCKLYDIHMHAHSLVMENHKIHLSLYRLGQMIETEGRGTDLRGRSNPLAFASCFLCWHFKNILFLISFFVGRTKLVLFKAYTASLWN